MAGRRQTAATRVLLNAQTSDLSGILAFARKAGWFVTPVSERELTDNSPAATVRRWNGDALIANLWGDGRRQRAWDRTGIPIVDLDPGAGGSIRPTVHTDFRAVGRLAAEHLLDRRFTHLACCWVGTLPWLEEEWQGFSQAARAGGARVYRLDWEAACHRTGDWSSRTLRRWLGQELRALPEPVGLFVESDWTGVEAIQGCQEAHLVVPEEVAIVGVYDLPVSEALPIPLSSVAIDDHRVGYEAGALLDRLLHGRRPPRQAILVPPRGVVVRQSSDTLAVPHAGVARAVQFIRTRYGEARVGVPEVVAAAGMSWTGLNKAFRAHLGCAVGEELRRTRLRQALGMLADTDLKAAAIAARCGYSSPDRLRERVLQETKLTPRAWRRRYRGQRSGTAAPAGADGEAARRKRP